MQFDSSPGVAADVGGMTAGARLRKARESRGESVNEVSLALKLAPRQVEALESGRYDALPGLAFVRGFMRNYARYLGLDPAPLLAEVQATLGQTDVDLSPVSNAAGDLPTGGGRTARTVPAGPIAAVLIAIVLAGWYFDWFDTAPPRAELETVAAPAAESVQEAAVAPIAAPALANAASVAMPEVPVAAAVEPAAIAPVPAPSPVAVAEPAPATTAVATEPGVSQLAFRFAGQSWVEVRDAGGAILHSGTGSAGSTRNVQGKAPFTLVIGNAAQVSLERDGQPVDLAPHTKGTVARLKLQ